MKRSSLLLILLITLMHCAEAPTQFSEVVLNDTFIALDGSNIKFDEVLKKYEGKQFVINVWASWCKDCIVGLPDLKSLQAEFPDAEFVFLSVDRNEATWKRSLIKYDLKGGHYFLPEGQKGVFGDFLNSNWIPRYMVIDTKGNIKLFKAKKATDVKIKEALL